MPKILILFAGPNTALAHAVADGARGVRFSEVEVRRVGVGELQGDGGIPDVYPTLAGVDELAPYDAILLGVSARGELLPELGRLVAQAATALPRESWQNKVGSAFVTAPAEGDESADLWPVLAMLGDLGLLVVSPAGSDADAAKALGARVAQVVGWVTHARSHHHAH
ncbi:hypothetical protein BH09GEM1_BH09GEM1_40280 [soil metagenome]